MGTSTDDLPARLSWWSAVPSGVVALGLAAFASHRQLAGLIHDDAFYYLNIARHIARGDGVTFDGLQPTDGFHPLWMVMLATLARTVPWDGAAAIRAVLCVHGALTACTAMLFDRLLGSVGAARWARVVGVAGLVPLLAAMDVGMESALWTCCTVAMLDAVVLRRPLWWQATTVLLVGLARTKGALLAIPVIAALAFRASWREFRWLLAIALFSPLAMLLARLAWTGHVVSVAASLKTQFGGILRFNWLVNAAWGIRVRLFLSVAVSLVLAPSLVAGVSGRSARGRLDAALVGAGVFAVAQGVALVFLSIGGVGSWYFGAPLTLAWLMALRVFHGWVGPRTALAVCVAAAYALAVVVSRRFISTPDKDAQLAVAGWLRDHTTPDAVIWQGDGSGAVAWYADRSVIDGDGLVGSWAYQRALAAGGLRTWMASAGVTWVVSDSIPTAAGLRLYVRRWHAIDDAYGPVDPARAVYRAGRYGVLPSSAFGLGWQAGARWPSDGVELAPHQ